MRVEDNGGRCVSLRDVRVCTGLDYCSEIEALPSDVPFTLVTYSIYFEDRCRLAELLGGRTGYTLYASMRKRPTIERYYGGLGIRYVDNTHAKMLLVPPDRVYLSSQNLGDTDWLQWAVSFRDRGAYEFYRDNLRSFLSQGLTGNISGYPRDRRSMTGSTGDRRDGGVTVAPDCHGLVLPHVKAKLARQVNWRQKFTGTYDGQVCFVSYRLPDLAYTAGMVDSLLARRNGVAFVVNSVTHDEAMRLACQYPAGVRVYCAPAIHMKAALVETGAENRSVWLSSHNVGASRQFESCIQLKGDGAFSYYHDAVCDHVRRYGERLHA